LLFKESIAKLLIRQLVVTNCQVVSRLGSKKLEENVKGRIKPEFGFVSHRHYIRNSRREADMPAGGRPPIDFQFH
jgi:hypothetical protein